MSTSPANPSPQPQSKPPGWKVAIKWTGRIIIVLVALAVVLTLSFGLHMHMDPADVQKSASHVMDAKLPPGCKWFASTHHEDERTITIEMREPCQLLIQLQYNPQTESRNSGELLRQSMKDKLDDAYVAPKHEFTREVGGEFVQFTPDTVKDKYLLMGALVTKKRSGVFITVEEVLPSDRKKELESVDEVWKGISAWH